MKNKFFLLEEFILDQIKIKNEINHINFDKEVIIHGHCHQKSQNRMKGLFKLLDTFNIKYKMIDSSCCGMAGSFGYNSKNYDISKKMAYLSLIPEINKTNENTFILANGTSCRNQISDFSNRKPKHIAELLFNLFERIN